jgi:hypothetical protein
MSVYTPRAMIMMMMMIIMNIILTSWNVILYRGKQSRKKHQLTPRLLYACFYKSMGYIETLHGSVLYICL